MPAEPSTLNWTKQWAPLVLPAQSFTAPWLQAAEFFAEVNLIKLVAEGEWEALPGILPTCGPDGLHGVPLADEALIIAGLRPGALIGKLGGGAAGLDAAPAAFAIGSGCLLKVSAETRGPLFISFNSRARPLAIRSLKLEISGTTI